MGELFHAKTAEQQRIERDRGQSIEDILSTYHAAGWSQVRVAEDLGVTRQTLAVWWARAGLPAGRPGPRREV